MSHLHFVAALQYQKRVIQLGEDPNSVFLVGGLGVDNIKRLKLLDKEQLQKSLGFEMGSKNLLITFHPVTLEKIKIKSQIKELLNALSQLQDTTLIFTLANADTDGRIINEMIKKFTTDHSNAHCFASLGQLRYLSCISQVDGVVGNSSSGLLEAPTFKKGTINIGDRQLGRLQSKSVINCKANSKSITSALQYLYSNEFQVSLKKVVNPYGNGGASEKIVKIIKKYPLNNIVKKTFYNIPFNIE